MAHSPQNLNWGGFSNPHFGQRLLSGEPQLPQNFMPCGFSDSQLEQRIPPTPISYGHVLVSHHGLINLDEYSATADESCAPRTTWLRGTTSTGCTPSNETCLKKRSSTRVPSLIQERPAASPAQFFQQSFRVLQIGE